MKQSTKRGIKEGIGFGIIAGVIFAVMEIIGAVLMGDPPLTPVRMIAGIVLGEPALRETPATLALPIGLIVHVVMSGFFGLIYGVVNAQLSATTETSYGRQAALGLVFGVALWFVNFQLFARAAFPWFLMSPQGLQVLLHAAFFGVPLALMYAAGERRAQHLGQPAHIPA